MANALPILRSTTGSFNAQVLYPFSRSVGFMTHVETFMNGSEQRWAGRAPLYGFKLPMSNLLINDKGNWLTFFNTVVGRFAQDLQITLGATAYNNLTLMSDDLAVVNRKSLIYDQELNLRQVSNGTWTPPTAGTAFPTLAFGTTGGAVAEKPFTQVSSYLTSVSDNPYGPRFAYSWYKAGLTNFPTTYLREWRIEYPLLNSTDITTLENFFLSQQGKLISFSFTDPLDFTTYTHVRFDQDSLDINYITLNQYSTVVTLRQTNGS